MSEERKFEDMIAELEKISQELEKGELPLDESMKKFEEGMKISKKCSDILESAEKKITILIKDGEEIKEEDFNVGVAPLGDQYRE